MALAACAAGPALPGGMAGPGAGQAPARPGPGAVGTELPVLGAPGPGSPMPAGAGGFPAGTGAGGPTSGGPNGQPPPTTVPAAGGSPGPGASPGAAVPPPGQTASAAPGTGPLPGTPASALADATTGPPPGATPGPLPGGASGPSPTPLAPTSTPPPAPTVAPPADRLAFVWEQPPTSPTAETRRLLTAWHPSGRRAIAFGTVGVDQRAAIAGVQASGPAGELRAWYDAAGYLTRVRRPATGDEVFVTWAADGTAVVHHFAAGAHRGTWSVPAASVLGAGWGEATARELVYEGAVATGMAHQTWASENGLQKRETSIGAFFQARAWTAFNAVGRYKQGACSVAAPCPALPAGALEAAGEPPPGWALRNGALTARVDAPSREIGRASCRERV